MVDERILEYLKNDLAEKNDEIKKLRLLYHRGFLIEPYSNGTIGINSFLNGYDDTDLLSCLNMNADEIVEKLFCRDSIMAHEVCSKYKDKWGKLFASSRVYGSKVQTMQLEPFIARLIHAISFCGMHTYYSCDGWHNKKNKYQDRAFIGFLDRNSLLWFITLLENDLDLSAVKVDYAVEDHFVTFYFDEEKRFDVYIALDRIADILYMKKEQFRNQKKWVINSLKGQQKSKLSDEPLKNIMGAAYNSCDVEAGSYTMCSWENVTKETAVDFIVKISEKYEKSKIRKK